MQSFYTVEEVFKKADINHDNYLNTEELSKWINMKTQEHIHESIVENYKIFLITDVNPKNGLVSWNEYHSYFLQKNGYNDSSYGLEYTGNGVEKIIHRKKMPRRLEEAIMRDKASWSETSKMDPNHLTLDEFLSFRHPESSYSTIISLVDEIYKKFDRDGDEILTEDEFSTFRFDDDDDDQDHALSEAMSREEKERRKEFRDVVDLNKDGKATRKEVLTYIDPKNPRHAKEEAETLISLADIDKDGRLSLNEIFNKIDLFLGSKMIDTGRSFHDEL
ncbi:45 kDa calcium-binding protein precursor, putative [Pediculus humanus corporis]|uniref:45 kDa calcium-binding protein, putative n=1 Tax=Pediculus humanus subsp. corporis TaxID=121224 RepID=E0VHT2_PEDHC|nr:45 kDa calcium-binding protein precursor, putative [Pediculus humanus corporis]EEB12855.1 45 kDa calcium-binding protein precursor, putative [Pediculus humanus corporis]